ncbi:MAG TPA: hypothetical protein VF210_09460 [Pseudomonadales bacterium]
MARREIVVFSLSFLDVMSCGFGALVLIFLIINHASEERAETVNQDKLAEVRMLDYQVREGEKDLFQLLQRMDMLERRLDESDRQLVSTRREIEDRQQDVAALEQESLAQVASLEELQSDVEAREKELERLRAVAQANEGGRIRSFTGEGDRQYLTGLKVGGKHILIALDVSASMLDERIVNVIRRRNMDDERKRQAPKWQRAVRTVEWIGAQLPLDANFQIYGFNTEARSLVPDAGPGWVALAEGRELDAAIKALKRTVPSGGTSLMKLVDAINAMSPLPDNVYLITDSLPTQGDREPRGPTIDGRGRLELFGDAIRKMPKDVPVNVILFPMEGDPMSAAAYWSLARSTRGSFLSPSRDWP